MPQRDGGIDLDDDWASRPAARIAVTPIRSDDTLGGTPCRASSTARSVARYRSARLRGAPICSGSSNPSRWAETKPTNASGHPRGQSISILSAPRANPISLSSFADGARATAAVTPPPLRPIRSPRPLTRRNTASTPKDSPTIPTRTETADRLLFAISVTRAAAHAAAASTETQGFEPRSLAVGPPPS